MARSELVGHLIERGDLCCIRQHAVAQHRYVRRVDGIVQHDKALFADGAHGHRQTCILEMAVLFSACVIVSSVTYVLLLLLADPAHALAAHQKGPFVPDAGARNGYDAFLNRYV